jgi:hypothetical protein
VQIQELRVIEGVVGFEPKLHGNSVVEGDAPVK